MIFLFTDFGAADLYVGQMHARLRRALPSEPIIDLLHEAPAFNVRASAHVLAALSAQLQAGDVCVAVVDPGVGGSRDAIALYADERWFVGPDNGLLSVLAARAARCEVFRIDWRPEELSVSFHGRDLFAPVAAQLARGEVSALAPKAELDVQFGGADLAQIVYIDHYGNAMTGLRARSLAHDAVLRVGAQAVRHARVFSEAPPQAPFWYANSIGLAEIAWRDDSAAARLGLSAGAVLAST